MRLISHWDRDEAMPNETQIYIKAMSYQVSGNLACILNCHGYNPSFRYELGWCRATIRPLREGYWVLTKLPYCNLILALSMVIDCAKQKQTNVHNFYVHHVTGTDVVYLLVEQH